MVAQLLLMATHRARLVGLPAGDLIEFVRRAMGTQIALLVHDADV